MIAIVGVSDVCGLARIKVLLSKPIGLTHTQGLSGLTDSAGIAVPSYAIAGLGGGGTVPDHRLLDC